VYIAYGAGVPLKSKPLTIGRRKGMKEIAKFISAERYDNTVYV
jgi:hypothetical protein